MHASTRKPLRHKLKVVKGTSELSLAEKTALDGFREAVQREYARLARKKIATVVLVGDKKVRAVPKKVKGRYVVREH